MYSACEQPVSPGRKRAIGRLQSQWTLELHCRLLQSSLGTSGSYQSNEICPPSGVRTYSLFACGRKNLRDINQFLYTRKILRLYLYLNLALFIPVILQFRQQPTQKVCQWRENVSLICPNRGLVFFTHGRAIGLDEPGQRTFIAEEQWLLLVKKGKQKMSKQRQEIGLLLSESCTIDFRQVNDDKEKVII